MSRRVNQLAVALLALSLSLPAPSAFAARNGDRGSSIGERLQRIVLALRNAFAPSNTADWPFPPRP